MKRVAVLLLALIGVAGCGQKETASQARLRIAKQVVDAATRGDRAAVASYFPSISVARRLVATEDAPGQHGEFGATWESLTAKETKKLLDAVRGQDLPRIELEDLGTTAMIESEKSHHLGGRDWGEVRVTGGTRALVRLLLFRLDERWYVLRARRSP